MRNANTINGGKTRADVSRAILPYFSQLNAGFGAKDLGVGAATGALTSVAGSVLMACIFIALILRHRNQKLAQGIDALCVDPLDGERLQVGGGIFRIEHLAVEEGLLAARRRRRNLGDAGTPSSLAASFQRSSRLTLAISALAS
jgi:hypothetical protein